MSLSTRDLELIEVALDSAISACSASFGGADPEMDRLVREYKEARKHVREMLNEP